MQTRPSAVAVGKAVDNNDNDIDNWGHRQVSKQNWIDHGDKHYGNDNWNNLRSNGFERDNRNDHIFNDGNDRFDNDWHNRRSDAEARRYS